MPGATIPFFKALFVASLTAFMALAVPTARAQAAPALVAAARTPDFDRIGRMAQTRAAKPYAGTPPSLPNELASLDYDGLRDVRFQSDRALWRDAKLPFEGTFFHLGGEYFRRPVRIHEIANGATRPVAYRSSDFNFGKNRFGAPDAWGDIGFAGFRLHYPLNTTAFKDELIVFQGASYFRALGMGQLYGLSARALAIDVVGGAVPEEFPYFTDFWFERPTTDARQVTFYALLDSPRATGAYRFDVTPGPSTAVDVKARLFQRSGATPAIGTFGIAPLTSMYFYGENQPRIGDFRPEVHDSDGLQIALADGEWLWRPLQNPATTMVNSFQAKSLRGFGLMQRDRNPASYEDVEARYEKRPSAWVQPIGDWGPGRVELVQLKTPDETHDNIVAYWVPERLPAPGEPLDLAYRILWQGDEQQRPPGAWAVQSRRGAGYYKQSVGLPAGFVQYVVDFAGPALDALPPNAEVKAVVSGDDNARVLKGLAYFNPVNKTWRMTVQAQRIDPAKPAELRAFLQHDNDSLSETWTNIVLPE